jgi:hypothetical protein
MLLGNADTTGAAARGGTQGDKAGVLGVIDLRRVTVVGGGGNGGGGGGGERTEEAAVSGDDLVELQSEAARNTVLRASCAPEAVEWADALREAGGHWATSGGGGGGGGGGGDVGDEPAAAAAAASGLGRRAITKRGSGSQKFRASVFSGAVGGARPSPGSPGPAAAAAMAAAAISLSGPLQKQSKFGVWQTRHFEAAGHYLKYYKVRSRLLAHLCACVRRAPRLVYTLLCDRAARFFAAAALQQLADPASFLPAPLARPRCSLLARSHARRTPRRTAWDCSPPSMCSSCASRTPPGTSRVPPMSPPR